MGRRGYPPELRRKVLDLVEAGRSVADDYLPPIEWEQQHRINHPLPSPLAA